ncbi:MAG: phosphohydrolase, partial [Desulfobacula sp.]|nr:phosphohydrolase [Desulfobacula sp.]
YLYDIGVKNVLKVHDSIKPEYMEKESPKVARVLMEKLGAKEELINEVIDIVGHHNRPVKEDSLNRKVMHDADMLTHMASCDKKNGVDDKEFLAKLDRLFLTTAGNELARQVLVETN